MAASAKMPPHALRLVTYAELDAYVRAFAAGHLHLLLLFGPPGVGKSRCLRQALDARAGWLSGQATPLGIYLEAYAYRHQPLVLDDVDGLYADRSGIRLLKALCQSEPVKTLGWHTATPILELLDVPHRFTTTSQVALVGNHWKTLNASPRNLSCAFQFVLVVCRVQRSLTGVHADLVERCSLWGGRRQQRYDGSRVTGLELRTTAQERQPNPITDLEWWSHGRNAPRSGAASVVLAIKCGNGTDFDMGPPKVSARHARLGNAGRNQTRHSAQADWPLSFA